jgi:hypothetical protein
MQTPMDRRGIVSFLAITFGITYAIEGALILAGFRVTEVPALYGQFTIAAVMWVPSLATILTVKWVTREGFEIARIRIGRIRPYITTALVVPACFAATYGLTWLLGLGSPDWQLVEFRSLLASAGAEASTMPPPGVILLAVFLASLVLGPTLNGIFGFGEELGWRGYLLPKLMPLGKPKAYLLVGVIWGLWHAPIVAVGFNYPGQPFMGILAMAGLTTAFGIYLNELALRNQSSILAGWTHGAFNGQAYGIWRILFPGVNPLLGGITGLVGIAVWLAVGLLTAYRGRDRHASG